MQNKKQLQKANPRFPTLFLYTSRSLQTHTSFSLHLKKLGHFNLSMVHSLP